MMDLDKLAAHPFLSGIDRPLLMHIAALAVERKFAPGDFLLREGDGANVLHLLESGRVSLEVHVPGKDAARISTAVAGDALGLSWMFPPARVHLDARAIEASTAFSMDAALLRQAMDANHDLGYALTRRLLRVAWERLERVRVQHLDLYR